MITWLMVLEILIFGVVCSVYGYWWGKHRSTKAEPFMDHVWVCPRKTCDFKVGSSSRKIMLLTARNHTLDHAEEDMNNER